MYLSHIQIKNFRAIKEDTVHFCKGLNVIVGENNGGKSCLLDALRITLGYGNNKRDIYVDKDDFHINKNELNDKSTDIEFHLFFTVEKPEEWASFTDLRALTSEGKQSLQLHFRYFIDDRGRLKYRIWGGDSEPEGTSVSADTWGLLYQIYMGALRDAENTLRPVKGNQLSQLYSKIQIKDTRAEDREYKEFLINNLRAILKEDKGWNELVTMGKDKINSHLESTTFSNKTHSVEIDFLQFEFHKILENLRIQIPLYSKEILGGDTTKQKYFEIYQNGLGYNNLIYIATILGDLKQKQETDEEMFLSLIIEEPEAHLHPQLQSVLFNYLNQIESSLGFQVFISSHSPTITAKANLDSLIVLQNNNGIASFSLKNSVLDHTNKIFLTKFLDVTKSQLFFANGVILVEGISEALLIPVFSQIMGDQFDIEKAGIELVNINGVAFDHFAKLFNSNENNKRLKYPCAILTDDDRDKETDEYSSRAKNAKSLEGGNLIVTLAKNTFEYELFMAGKNGDLLSKLFTELHPKASANVDGETIEEYAMNFVKKVTSNKAKSELAHLLSVTLESNNELRKDFVIPEYIQTAIKFVTQQ